MKPADFSAAYGKFLSSMHITLDQWRDGIGFDIDALGEMTDVERETLTVTLADRLKELGDWREMEALLAIGTQTAKAAVHAALKSPKYETRLHAAQRLADIGEPVDLEAVIIATLRNTGISNGFSKAIDVAEYHPSPHLQEALLDLALNGTEEQRIHCAALALFHGGKSDEAFDWNHRPFFLRFSDEDRRIQVEAHRELCQRLGIVPEAPGNE